MTKQDRWDMLHVQDLGIFYTYRKSPGWMKLWMQDLFKKLHANHELRLVQ